MDRDGIILECVVGSTAHGTNVNDGLEDLDLMAVKIEAPKQFFGGNDVWTHRTQPEGVKSKAGDTDWVCYGLKKYLGLALKGNPTALLMLFAEPRFSTEKGVELQALRNAIVSKRAYYPFRGYIDSQQRKLHSGGRLELIERYGYDTKAAGHMLRLALQGIEILGSGKITLPMPELDRGLVVSIRNGGFTLSQFETLMEEMRDLLDQAYLDSPIRDEPQQHVVDSWMIEAYMQAWYEFRTTQAPKPEQQAAP